VLENKQSREINDSAIIMISMTYDHQCETLKPFVSPSEIFVSLSPVLGCAEAPSEMGRDALLELETP
jgi:hypothetical protein